MASSLSPQPKRRRKCTNLFDYLPSELVHRIVTFLPPKRHLYTALSLYRVSPHHRESIVKALNHSITFPTDPRVDESIHLLFGEDLHELHLGICYLPQHAEQLLRSRNLRKAVLTDVHVRFISSLTSLRDLRLELELPRESDFISCVGTSLYSLDLTSLTITCHLCTTKCNLLAHLSQLVSQKGAFCPMLSSLSLDCTKSKCHDILPLVPHFPHLKHLSLHRYIYPENVGKLQLVPHVHLYGWSAHANAMLLPKKTVSVRTRQPMLQSHIQALRKCPMLEDVCMDMEIGSERVLGPATGALRSIDLFWSGEDGIYQLTEGCLADVVQKNPELERLAVRNVDVSTTEIQQVLIQTAQKLRSLTLPFIGNHRVSDLNAIMQTMAVWNLRLECFEIEKENRWYMAWISNPALNVADAERLACSLNVLRKRIPRLDCFQVERCIALIASGN